MKCPALFLLAATAGATFPCPAWAQFADTFDSLNPAWAPNRYDPAGFESVVFDGDNRLRLTVDASGSTANRPVEYSSDFYGIQGRQRAGGISGPWSLSAQVYVASAYNTTTGPLVSSELWGHTGSTPEGGAYLTLGFTNASPTDGYNAAAADRSFRFQAWDAGSNDWINLGLPGSFQFDAWHTLTGTSTGAAFEYRIDGVLVLTHATATGSDLLHAMVQGYNFDQAGSQAVYWDDVTASAIPEPALTTFAVALTALGLVLWRRRRSKD